MKKELFDISKYPTRTVMNCETESEALEFCVYLESIGECWGTGAKYSDENYWQRYREDTCYNFNEGAYSDIGYYERHGYLILKSKNFIFKDEFEPVESKELTDFINGFLQLDGG